MANEAHMSKLEAVNDMLLSIGETPVQSLDGGQNDAAIAESVLDRSSRRIQLKGWHVNTLRSYELSKNASNQFVVGIDVLKIDTVNPDSGRANNTPSPNSYINASLRRSADDTKWLLFDVDNNSETWTNETTLTVDMVQFLDFKNLPPSLQNYIAKDAGRRYQKGAMGSRVLHAFTQEDVAEAEIDALQEDMENEDRNVFRNDRTARQIVYRFNPTY